MDAVKFYAGPVLSEEDTWLIGEAKGGTVQWEEEEKTYSVSGTKVSIGCMLIAVACVLRVMGLDKQYITGLVSDAIGVMERRRENREIRN